jgi:hypothetical protein
MYESGFRNLARTRTFGSKSDRSRMMFTNRKKKEEMKYCTLNHDTCCTYVVGLSIVATRTTVYAAISIWDLMFPICCSLPYIMNGNLWNGRFNYHIVMLPGGYVLFLIFFLHFHIMNGNYVWVYV